MKKSNALFGIIICICYNIICVFLDSFINVLADYRKRRDNYIKSYKQFPILNTISPYLLLPIVIKPNGIFLKIWAILRVCTAYVLSLLIPVSIFVHTFVYTCFG